MLIIELFNASAVWNEDEGIWESRNEHVRNLLNATLPEDIGHVHIAFLEGGRQGYVLAAAQVRLGPYITILKETEVEMPPEVEGQED